MVEIRAFISRMVSDDRRVIVLYQHANDKVPEVSIHISDAQYKALLLVGVQDLQIEIGKISGERITGNAAARPETVPGG